MQKHFQKNVLKLYQDADKLSYVCLFNECFLNATSVDLVTPRLTQIGKEVSLSCTALQEVVIPTELQEIDIRAFCGCEQLRWQ